MTHNFCSLEHLGGCSDTLTHRVEWFGVARRAFGQWAYYCGNHAERTSHLTCVPLDPVLLRVPVIRTREVSS